MRVNGHTRHAQERSETLRPHLYSCWKMRSKFHHIDSEYESVTDSRLPHNILHSEEKNSEMFHSCVMPFLRLPYNEH